MLLRCETFRDAKLNFSQLQYSRKASKKKNSITNSQFTSRFSIIFADVKSATNHVTFFVLLVKLEMTDRHILHKKSVFSGAWIETGEATSSSPQTRDKHATEKRETWIHLPSVREFMFISQFFFHSPSFLLLFRISLWRFLIELHTLNFYFIYWLCRT